MELLICFDGGVYEDFIELDWCICDCDESDEIMDVVSDFLVNGEDLCDE